jgi:hypothetical protein
LLIGALAKNKVEGMTYLKAANVTYSIPLAALFITSGLKYAQGFFLAL